MSTYKHKNLFKVKRSKAERLGDWILRNGPVVVWAVIGIIFIMALLVMQVTAREDFLLTYGSQ